MSARLARVATGAVVGLTWAAALRGWMVELAGPASTFSARTVVAVLAPATVAGAVCGWSWARRVEGLAAPRWAAWSPLLLASTVAIPDVLRTLFANGQGGGALLVAGAGAAGAVGLSRTGRSPGRTAALIGWGLGVAAVGALGTFAGSPLTPRGALVCATGAGLVALLGVGLALNHRDGPVLEPTGRRLVVVGAAATWAATATLVLTGERPLSDAVGGPLPLAIWAATLAVGLVVTGLLMAGSAAAYWSRQRVRTTVP